VTEAAARSVPPAGNSASTPWRLPALVVLMLAYTFSGRLALLLAIPPGYATAIFPPAGIGVAAVLCGGLATLPWIFCGSLALNLWVSFGVSGHLDFGGMAAGVLIAAASTLQAGAGGMLLRRVLGQPTPMDHAAPLLRFVVLAPLICLISATCSVAGLRLLGFVPLEAIASSWFTWWIGDTLGVLVMLPLTLILVGEPRALWRKRLTTLGIPTLIGFALFVLIFIKVNAWEQVQTLQEFRLVSQRVVDRVDREFEAQQAALEQTERAFSGAQAISSGEFRHLVARMRTRYPMIRAVEWAPQLPLPQRAAFEREHGFSVQQLGPTAAGPLVTAAQRTSYFPVTYVDPVEGNEAALGFDIASKPRRIELLTGAQATGLSVISEPTHLVQDIGRPDSGSAVLVLTPVQEGAMGPGFLAFALRMQDFFGALLPFAQDSLLLRFSDVGAQETLYDSFGQPGPAALFEAKLDIGGRHYLLQTAPTPAYIQNHHGWQSWSVLSAGLLFIGLLEVMLLLGTGSTARTEALVVERTQALNDRIAEIHALQVLLQEQAVRDPLSGLYNRRYLDETLDRELVIAQRQGYPVSIVMGDLDNFKKLNDTYGHQAGDEVIKLLADFLRKNARSSDILCRFGGEEFLLVLPGIKLEAACERVNRWREEFATHQVSFGSFQLSATISFGVAAYPDHGKTAERLIAAADKALYRAKAKGRNRVEAFSGDPLTITMP
jgi:diguanylate cyclase (GGDEF)-like protein